MPGGYDFRRGRSGQVFQFPPRFIHPGTGRFRLCFQLPELRRVGIRLHPGKFRRCPGMGVLRRRQRRFQLGQPVGAVVRFQGQQFRFRRLQPGLGKLQGGLHFRRRQGVRPRFQAGQFGNGVVQFPLRQFLGQGSAVPTRPGIPLRGQGFLP